MADSLETGHTTQDRLKSHAKAFDGLLSLIPAKYYYGEDTSDQWQKKKQTKEEARRAKMAKLDPDSAMAKSAKDVMDENARKRKREEEEGPDIEGVEIEQPKQGLKAGEKKAKKQKKSDKIVDAGTMSTQKSDPAPVDTNEAEESARKAKAEKVNAKKERKKAQQLAKEEKKQKKQKKRSEKDLVRSETGKPDDEELDDEESKMQPMDITLDADDTTAQQDRPTSHKPSETLTKGLLPQSSRSTVSPSSAPDSPIFDVANGQSGASSISSIVPPTAVPKIKKTAADSAELRARLQARIDALRADRKADGLNGAPARNRQELLEARRQKEEERKAHKKELRLKAKEEEREARERTLLASLSPSIGSPLPAVATAPPANNFSFGRVAFNDGQQMDADLTNLLDPRRRKGPQDPLTALKAADNKRSRLSGLDETKRKDIEEKDLWLNARKRAHGERIRDDTSLLKKTLKRKEKAKKKSEHEWKERLEGVEKGKEIRQKKREDNLRKRREEKGTKGGKKGGAKKGKSKKQNRPGFEGSFKSKASPGKSK